MCCDIMLCPKCGELATHSIYFRRYLCSNCDWESEYEGED
jgi:ribosomal protein S27AE